MAAVSNFTEYRKRVSQTLAQHRQNPLAFSGGDGSSGDMEARISRLEAFAESTDRRVGAVEADVRDLRKDIRQLLYATIAGCAVILGFLVTGYIRLDDKISTTSEKTEMKIDKISERMEKISDRIDSKLEKIVERLPPLPAKP